MRVPPPGLLKLNSTELLRDVRAKLAEKYPDYADEDEQDSTDPAWIILEQAAWLVEMLSEQLDQYPYSMIQEFVHMMGGRLNPALPALGVIIADPAEAGVFETSEEKPSPWRFFTLQTEDMDMIEFSPVESEVHLRHANILSYTEIKDGEMYVVGTPKSATGIGSLEAWKNQNQHSRVFDGEWVRYDLVSSNAEDLLKVLNAAIESLEERKIGWLEFRADMISPERVSLFARINLSKAFAHTVPSGLTDGTDVRGHWGTLDDSSWVPQIRLSTSRSLPPKLRGGAVMPGLRRGTIVIPGVPENFRVEELLQKKSMPIPSSVVTAIWETLTHMDQKLAALKPSISRGVEAIANPIEPTWISDALDKSLWGTLVDRSIQRYIHINVAQADPVGGKLRVALVLKGISEDKIPDIRIFGIEEEGGLQARPLNGSIKWKLRLPDPAGGQRMVLVVAMDIPIGPEHKELLIATECNPICVMTNALMVINAPTVNDGRQIQIERNIPEPVNLLYDDVVNNDVVYQLLLDNIPFDAAKHLRNMPLAYFPVHGGAPIQDYKGVWMDPTSPLGEGAMMRLNAPDKSGEQRAIRPGKTVYLEWYRRTDGADGNVPAGTINVIEQPPSAKPVLLAIHNPLDTFFGTDREHEQEAVDRMFNPSAGVPVMPADWEAMFRGALGVKARGWMVRCWSHPERSLVTTDLWPLPKTGFETDRSAAELRRKIANSDPETLLVVVGSEERLISDEELDWARGIIKGIVRRQMQRIPLIKRVVVTKFHALTLECLEGNDDIPLPSFNIDDMEGVLTDVNGYRVRPSKGRLLLNAAVVRTEAVYEVKL